MINHHCPGVIVTKGGFKIDDWQSFKKLCHVSNCSIDPNDFDFSLKQLNEMTNPGGVVVYLQKGGELPPKRLIEAYSNSIKQFCEHPDTIQDVYIKTLSQ